MFSWDLLPLDRWKLLRGQLAVAVWGGQCGTEGGITPFRIDTHVGGVVRSCVGEGPVRRPGRRTFIIGHLIPAGSGIYRYAEIDIQPPAGFEPPPPRVEEPVPQPVLTAAAMLADDEL
jgi:hypothetical protein